jgi:transposase
MSEAVLYDTRQAAELLSVSKNFLERLRMEGDGPKFKKIQGRGRNRYLVRYTREALVEWARLQPDVGNTTEADMRAAMAS